MASFFRRLTKKFFIVANIITAIVFLIGCYGPAFTNGKEWVTGFFTLAAPYIAVLLVAFIFLWLFTRPGWMLISLLTFAISWSPLRKIFALRFTPDFVQVKHPSNLRIMNWNVEHFKILEHKTHPEKKQAMIELIRKYDPDIACFQEFVGSDDNPKAINYLPDIIDSLRMKGYHYSYNKKLDFDHEHHFGLIMFSKVPMISKHTISYPPNNYNSIFQYADFLWGNDTVRVFNIHLQSLKFSSENLTYLEHPESDGMVGKSKSILSKLGTGFNKRIAQSNRIKKEMDKSPYPIVVCGDFNDVPNSYAYNTIGQNLNNAFEVKGTGISRTFRGISPTLRIDNIFVDKRFNVEQFTRLTEPLSDHYAIIADIFNPFPKP